MTPDQAHYGQADEIYAARQSIPDRAFQLIPERSVNQRSQPPPNRAQLVSAQVLPI